MNEPASEKSSKFHLAYHHLILFLFFLWLSIPSVLDNLYDTDE